MFSKNNFISRNKEVKVNKKFDTQNYIEELNKEHCDRPNKANQEQYQTQLALYKKGKLKKEPEKPAPVKITPPLDPQTHGAALERYKKGYEVITQKQFNKKTQEIANAITKLSPDTTFSLVTSKPGKSNFWVAEQVLAKTKRKPQAIYTVRVKEDSDQNQIKKQPKATAQISEEDLKMMEGDDNHVLIFLDDAAYSGSQFRNLLSKFEGINKEKIKIGQVARSEDAKNKVEELGFNDKKNNLVPPIEIKKANRKDQERLNDIAKVAKPDLFDNQDKNRQAGLYQTAMFYKVPDYASTMDYVPMFEKNGKPYKSGQEPYKNKEYLKQFYNPIEESKEKGQGKSKKKRKDLTELDLTLAKAEEMSIKDNVEAAVVRDIKIIEITARTPEASKRKGNIPIHEANEAFFTKGNFQKRFNKPSRRQVGNSQLSHTVNADIQNLISRPRSGTKAKTEASKPRSFQERALSQGEGLKKQL